jgi:hypothetical protein
MFLFLGAVTTWRKPTFSCVMSVRMEQLSSYWKNFPEICYLKNVRKSVQKYSLDYNLRRITGTLHEDVQYTFMTLSLWIILEWEMF